MRRHYAKGGSVQNESLNPRHEDPEALATSDIDHLRLGDMAQNHEDMPESSEPKREVHPMEEDMGRNNPIGERITRALRMSKGGSVDERHIPEPGENRRLAMNDTYPIEDSYESDTMAQDKDEAHSPSGILNQGGDEDQDMAQAATSRTPVQMAEGGSVPRDLNAQPRHGQDVVEAMNERSMEDQDEARKGRLQRALDEVMRFHRNPSSPLESPGRISNSNVPVPSGDQRQSNKPKPGNPKRWVRD